MNYSRTTSKLLLITIFTLLSSLNCTAQSQLHTGVKMQFSDGRPEVIGIENVNAVLREVGVRTSLVSIPSEAKTLLDESKNRAITEKEKEKLLLIFRLNRAELLEYIQLAGRTPEAHRGGNLSITALNGGQYPSISDLQGLTKEVRASVIKQYGKLHVNSNDDGMGIDELMTVVSGGPFTWFFVLKNGVVTKLTSEPITTKDSAFRISYPGMVIHGGYFPEKGIAIGYAHGPKNFVIRFEESSVPHRELLNTNPWIDFQNEFPALKNKTE